MKVVPQYPPEIRSGSDQQRLKYFVDDVIIDHQVLENAMARLDELANPLLEQRIIPLLGGSGVGKSALMKKLVKKRTARRSEEIAVNAQIVPAVFYEVEAPDKGEFAFSSLYRGFLGEIGAALVDRTLPVVEKTARDKSIRALAVEQAGRRIDADALKERFIRNLVERTIEMACLDEAINIFAVGRPRSERERLALLKAQAGKLKTFGNKTPTTLVLAGAYDFFELTLVSGQIARRSSIVHMEPYTMTPNGLVEFAKALVGLLAHLPIEHDLDPEIHATELFLQCLGCIGTLKNILTSALLKALGRKQSLTIGLVRESYFTTAQLNVMRDEMEIGIKRVRELITMEQQAGKAEATSSSDTAAPGKNGRKLKPGETTPSHRKEAAEEWAK